MATPHADFQDFSCSDGSGTKGKACSQGIPKTAIGFGPRCAGLINA
jgi:hypothetical protein